MRGSADRRLGPEAVGTNDLTPGLPQLGCKLVLLPPVYSIGYLPYVVLDWTRGGGGRSRHAAPRVRRVRSERRASLEAQRRSLAAACTRHGWQLLEALEDARLAATDLEPVRLLAWVAPQHPNASTPPERNPAPEAASRPASAPQATPQATAHVKAP